MSEPRSGPGAEAVLRNYFARLERVLAPMPRARRGQIIADLRDHVAAALAEGTPAQAVLDALGPPEDIASEAFAGGAATGGRRWRPRLRYALALVAVIVAAVGGTVGYELTGDTSPTHPATGSQLTAKNVANANSTCAPVTVAGSSGGPAATLTATGTEVASGTVGGRAWTLWSKKGEKGAQGLEDGGLVLDGRAYGLCPGYPNPAELELADTGGQGIAYGVIGYPGLAKVSLYRSSAGTFAAGADLPAPAVKVVDGVSFFIGTLPQSACAYPSLELNSTSPGVSDEHNLGFGACTAGKLVPISESQGIWQLPAGHFVSNFPSGPSSPSGPGSSLPVANSPTGNSICSPVTTAALSGAPASALTSTATKVAAGTTDGQAWTLWSAKGQSGAKGLEDGGLVLDGRAYGLCPGFPNPAELELADTGTHGIAYGVIGYPGLAKVSLYRSTTGTFATGAALPSPAVKVVDGVSFFIGALPQSACAYPSLELNAADAGVSAEHNLGFGACAAGKVVAISASQGSWQPPAATA